MQIDIASIYKYISWYDRTLNKRGKNILPWKTDEAKLRIYGFLSLYQDHVAGGREKNLYSYWNAKFELRGVTKKELYGLFQ